MERCLLELINDFQKWKGDSYRLARLVAETQKERIAEMLDAAGQTDAAELVRGM